MRYRPFPSVHGQHDVLTIILSTNIGCGKRTEGINVTYLRTSLAGELLIQRSHRLAIKYLAVRAVSVPFKQDVADVYRSARYIGSIKSKYVIDIIK